MSKKVYTVVWEHIKDQSIQVDYAEGINPNDAIISLLGVILLDPEDTHLIALNAPKAGLVKLIRYLKLYGVKVGVRTVPDYEEFSKGLLTYLKGDATYPQTKNPVVIPHICNDIGAWGSGFVIAVSKRWPEPEQHYLKIFQEGRLKLGRSYEVPVEDNLTIVNMISQSGTRSSTNTCPISYDALCKGLAYVCRCAKKNKAEVHMPKIGSDRAGGNWKIIEEIIIEKLVDNGINVFVYEFEG